MQTPTAPTVAVLGLGLVGGSLLQLLHQRGDPVVGYDIDPATRRLAASGLATGRGEVAETMPAALA
ncbi:MAG: prephenate dehydrogenase, partial [Mycobacteriales bacterium]